jgi:hypothetical protein
VLVSGRDCEVNRFFTKGLKMKGLVTRDHEAFATVFTPPLPAGVQSVVA